MSTSNNLVAPLAVAVQQEWEAQCALVEKCERLVQFHGALANIADYEEGCKATKAKLQDAAGAATMEVFTTVNALFKAVQNTIDVRMQSATE
jgi:hypothetical protein